MLKKFFAAGFILAVGAISAMAAGTDTGFVKDANGNPVAGATVTYLRGTNSWTTTTNASGVYRFPLGTQNATVIGVAAGGGVGGAGTFIAQLIGYDSSAAQNFTVTVADTTGGAAIGNPNLVITARSVSGTVTDAYNANLIIGARVQQKRAGAIIDSAFTNASGVYSLSIVAGGDSLIVSATSYLPGKNVVAFPAAALTAGYNFQLSAFVNITGIVSSSLLKSGINGATVSAAKLVNGVAQTPFAVTTTTAQGAYTFDSLASHDSLQIQASAASFSSVIKLVEPVPVGPALDSVNIALGMATGSIIGTIMGDSADGNPGILAGATVTLTKGAAGTLVGTTTTNAAGMYAFAGDSANIKYTVTAAFDGYGTLSDTMTTSFAASDTDVANITLQAGTAKTFWVKVVGWNGTPGSALTPLANASVGFTKGATVLGGVTNAAGVVQITNAPVGFDTLTAADTMYQDRLMVITSNAYSADTIIDSLTQVANGTVQRSVRGIAHKLTAAGAPAAGANILFKCAGGYVYDAVTLTNGSWSVVGIDASIPAFTSIPAYAAATGLGMFDSLGESFGALADTFWNSFTNPAAITIAANGSTTSATVVVFTVSNVVIIGTVPAAPALSLPANGGTFTPKVALTLSWGTSATATTYAVRVSTSSTFANTVFGQTGLTATMAAYTPAHGINYYWEAAATNQLGTGAWSGVWSFTPSVSVLPSLAVNNAYRLSMKLGTISYSLPSSAKVELAVYDILGRTALTLNRQQEAGSYSINLKGSTLAAGQYIVRFKAGAYEQRAFMLLTK
jgi:hypothetical protein